MFVKNLENNLQRALSFKNVLVSVSYSKNNLYIYLDFSKCIQEEKRKDYYITLVKNIVNKQEIELLKQVIISGKINRKILWETNYNPESLREDQISENQNNQDNSLIDEILAEGLVFQKKRTFKPAGKIAKQLAEELLDLLNNDKNKAEIILKSIINFSADNSIEWYLEKAIAQVLKEQNKSIK